MQAVEKKMNASAIVLSHERKERWCSSLKVEVLLHSYDGIFTPINFFMIGHGM